MPITCPLTCAHCGTTPNVRCCEFGREAEAPIILTTNSERTDLLQRYITGERDEHSSGTTVVVTDAQGIDTFWRWVPDLGWEGVALPAPMWNAYVDMVRAAHL